MNKDHGHSPRVLRWLQNIRNAVGRRFKREEDSHEPLETTLSGSSRFVGWLQRVRNAVHQRFGEDNLETRRVTDDTATDPSRIVGRFQRIRNAVGRPFRRGNDPNESLETMTADPPSEITIVISVDALNRVTRATTVGAGTAIGRYCVRHVAVAYQRKAVNRWTGLAIGFLGVGLWACPMTVLITTAGELVATSLPRFGLPRAVRYIMIPFVLTNAVQMGAWGWVTFGANIAVSAKLQPWFERTLPQESDGGATECDWVVDITKDEWDPPMTHSNRGEQL